LLDFYDYLGEINKGKNFIQYLLTLIVDSPEKQKVFYPGHLNPMNMSQNVIDTGTAVDAIARFVRRNREVFSETEYQDIKRALEPVADTYLVKAANDKKVTNQRLWGLTGLASYSKTFKEDSLYQSIAEHSIKQAFTDSTVDGFFRYYPNPENKSVPYDNITTFYQSRHIAFIQYSLNVLGMSTQEYEHNLEKSISALLAMYTYIGVKDLRMETKRWYWLSEYEVASHAFDAYALAHSNNAHAQQALSNVLYQIKDHFFNGFLHSHKGRNFNFQCPIFWTAHLAWLTRIPNIEALFDTTNELKPFVYRFVGKDIFSDTNQKRRILINKGWAERNPTTGIFNNGLSSTSLWKLQVPKIPRTYLFSVREVVNHSWSALRGGHMLEAVVRLWQFFIESIVMLLPRYCICYGKVVDFKVEEEEVKVSVVPGSKYGTLLDSTQTVINISL